MRWAQVAAPNAFLLYRCRKAAKSSDPSAHSLTLQQQVGCIAAKSGPTFSVSFFRVRCIKSVAKSTG
jgi:hypothetical protein